MSNEMRKLMEISSPITEDVPQHKIDLIRKADELYKMLRKMPIDEMNQEIEEIKKDLDHIASDRERR